MKVLILFSGGLDSTTALAMAVNQYGANNCVALSLYYGQKHNKEIQAAKKIIEYYNVQWKQLDLSKIFADSNCCLLEKSNADIPEESYESQLKKANGLPVSTYVPYRNGLFISVAASMALSLNCNRIIYGAHMDDAAGNAYPDCSNQFNNAINQAVFLGTGKQVQVVAPFIDKTKADIVKIGTDLKVPYELTWSCYKGNEKPCGVCGTCIDRRRAFEANNIVDPLG